MPENAGLIQQMAPKNTRPIVATYNLLSGQKMNYSKDNKGLNCRGRWWWLWISSGSFGSKRHTLHLFKTAFEGFEFASEKASYCHLPSVWQRKFCLKIAFSLKLLLQIDKTELSLRQQYFSCSFKVPSMSMLAHFCQEKWNLILKEKMYIWSWKKYFFCQNWSS